VKKGQFEIEQLKEGIAPTVTTNTVTGKVPGPTDVAAPTATNPGGK
jgi:hypothetical protein